MKTQENKDMASPSLEKLLKTEASSLRTHFDSGGMIDGGGDSWGSISKMLHQRYNSSSNESRGNYLN